MNQIERHPRLPGKEMVAFCSKHGILTTAYSAFGNNNWGLPLLVAEPDVKAIADRLSEAQGKPVTTAQVILAWAQRDGQIVIPKSVTASRIRENFQEVDIDDDAVAALDKIGEKPIRLNIPTTCKSCPVLWEIAWARSREQMANVPMCRQEPPMGHQHLERGEGAGRQAQGHPQGLRDPASSARVHTREAGAYRRTFVCWGL